MNAITNAEQAAAEAAAREELRRTIALYCAAQPNGGAGIEICTSPARLMYPFIRFNG